MWRRETLPCMTVRVHVYSRRWEYQDQDSASRKEIWRWFVRKMGVRVSRVVDREVV